MEINVSYQDHKFARHWHRLLQDPLAEACQLWHELPDENGTLSHIFLCLADAVTTDVWIWILDGMHSAIPLSLPSKGMSKKIVAKVL